MKEKDILIQAANILDDTAIKVQFEVINEVEISKYKLEIFGLKFGKYTISEIQPETKIYYITGAKLRTMIRVSKLILKMEGVIKPQALDPDWIFSLVANNCKLAAEAIAAAIHNNKSEVPQSLIDELIDHLDSDDLARIFEAVIEKLKLAPFMNTIASIRTMEMMKMEEASPQEQQEIIASGEQLETLQNIFGSATIKS